MARSRLSARRVELVALAHASEEVALSAGTVMTQAGDAGTSSYVVIEAPDLFDVIDDHTDFGRAILAALAGQLLDAPASPIN